MSVAIGGTWLAARGAVSVRDLCVHCLDLGYSGLVPAPGTRPMPWAQFRAAAEDLPFDFPAIRVDAVFEKQEGSLASSRADEVLAARQRVAEAAALGARLGTRRLILEAPLVALPDPAPETDLRDTASAWSQESYEALGTRLRVVRDGFLDRFCRNLHQICGELADFQVCLTESPDLLSLSQIDDLQEVMGDLARQNLGYWHRPALVGLRRRLGGAAAGECLESLSKFLIGTDLADFDASGLQAIPGSGGVDYGVLAPYMRSLETSLPTVLEIDPACRDGDLKQGRAFLRKYGL